MKKELALIGSFVFLLCTAMRCEENRIDVETELKEVKLFHVNNTGKQPILAGDEPVKKEAYMLCIQLLCEETNLLEKYPHYYLGTPITQLDIYTVENFNEEYPAGSNISVSFKNYPLTLRDNVVHITERGGVIKDIGSSIGNIYKALMTIPPAGTYQFRVALTLANDEIIERITEPIELY